MKNILITGGAGFIGYHLAKYYSNKKDYSVLILDDFSRGENDKHFKDLIKDFSNIEYIKIDLCNMDEHIIGYLGAYKFEIIYHLAARNGTNHFYESPSSVLCNNIISTLNLLESLSKKNCKKLIFASTCETYYGTINKFGEEFLPTNERVPLCIDNIFNPRTSYAIGKIAGESMVINMCKEKKIPFNIIRYHNVYGERMGVDGHVIPDVIRRIKNAKDTLDAYGGNQTRSFIHIDDAIRDTTLIANSELNNQIFNVGNEVETKISKLIEILIDCSGKDLTINEKGHPSGSVNRRLPDMSKFNIHFNNLKYITLQKGLERTYLWYMKNYE